MRRHPKITTVATRVLRNAALSAAPAARRAFPAWIDAADGAAFSATAVTSRVRDALVLRPVGQKKSGAGRAANHVPGAR